MATRTARTRQIAIHVLVLTDSILLAIILRFLLIILEIGMDKKSEIIGNVIAADPARAEHSFLKHALNEMPKPINAKIANKTIIGKRVIRMLKIFDAILFSLGIKLATNSNKTTISSSMLVTII